MIIETKTGKMMFSLFLKSLLIFTCLNVTAYAGERYILNPEHASSSFEYRHWFSNYRGNFKTVSGYIDFDPDQKTGYITLEIDANSVNTGSEFFDKTMRSSHFFDTQQFRHIIFKSTQFIFGDNKLRQIKGDLTIKDLTKPVVIDVTEFNCRIISTPSKKACDAAGQTRVLRSNYKMTRFASIVSDEITLYFRVEGISED